MVFGCLIVLWVLGLDVCLLRIDLGFMLFWLCLVVGYLICRLR